MKRIWTTMGLAMLLTGSLAQAERNVMRARIPFAFDASGVTLPAGTYTVTTGIAPGIVRIYSFENKASALVPTHGTQAPAARRDCALVFNRYGDRYFLFQVWEGGNSLGFQLRKTKAEIETAAAKSEIQVRMVAAQR